MTEKELLYIEDAIKHEESLIMICDDISNKVTEEELVTFFNNEIKKHEKYHNKLINYMEDKSDE